MKTVRVRIAVCIDENGHWCASADSDWNDARKIRSSNFGNYTCQVHFIEADIPIPEPQTIEGVVK